MTDWSQDYLDTVGDADEVELAVARADGTLSPYVTIWIVRAGDELYLRSATAATVPGITGPLTAQEDAYGPLVLNATLPSPSRPSQPPCV